MIYLLLQDKVNSNEKSDEKSEEEEKASSDLFSAVLTKSKSPEKESSNDSIQESNEDKTESLVEAAKKYEEMKSAQKRKYEEVQVTTGEEDEKNILEVNCKLFTFIDNNYEERGRGTLRLNDSKDNSYSRVVFRSAGSFRVLLNTKVFRDQVCETPSQKSLRLTAVDSNGGVKIFLVMGRNEDISRLHQLFSMRIQRAKDRPEDEDEKVVDETPENYSQQSDVVEPETKRTAISSD
jgi:Ran-binding protein 3